MKLYGTTQNIMRINCKFIQSITLWHEANTLQTGTTGALVQYDTIRDNMIQCKSMRQYD